jgi:hypothetical protein
VSAPWEKDPIVQKPPWERDAIVSEQPAQAQQRPSYGQIVRDGVVNPGRDLLAGAVRGAGSIGATLLAPYDIARSLSAGEAPLTRNRQRRQDITGGLQSLGADTDSMAFGAGKLGGEIAGTLGAGPAIAAGLTRAAPWIAARAAPLLDAIRTGGFSAGGQTGLRALPARTAGGAVTGGAAAGAVNPEDAGTGAALGAALPGVVKATGTAGSAVGGVFRPNINNAPLAERAINNYGIPLGPADISASRFTKATRSVLNDAPFTAGIGERQGAAVQQRFNRAVGDTFGANSDTLTLDVLDAAKQRMGAEFDRIWGQNTLAVDSQLMQQLMVLQQRAAKLPRSEGASLNAELQDLMQKMTTDAAGNVVIPGDVANKFQSYIRRRAEGSQGLRNELTDLRRSIISAFNRGVSPADAAALTNNRTQYKAFKTVEPLMARAEAGVAGRAAGDVPAALLPQAVVSSYGVGMGGTPLGELAQIGSQYIVPRVAQTGGSARAAIQNAAVGAGLLYGGVMNPAALGAVPAAMGAQSLLGSPTAARAALAAQQRMQASGVTLSPEFQRFLFRSAPQSAQLMDR